jgi:hypothetical protein
MRTLPLGEYAQFPSACLVSMPSFILRTQLVHPPAFPCLSSPFSVLFHNPSYFSLFSLQVFLFQSFFLVFRALLPSLPVCSCLFFLPVLALPSWFSSSFLLALLAFPRAYPPCLTPSFPAFFFTCFSFPSYLRQCPHVRSQLTDLSSKHAL